MPRKKKVELKRSSDYDYNPDTDLTDDDIYLIQNPKDNPKEHDLSRDRFKALTGEEAVSASLEEILEKQTQDGKFEYFNVHFGWKTGKIWRLVV